METQSRILLGRTYTVIGDAPWIAAVWGHAKPVPRSAPATLTAALAKVVRGGRARALRFINVFVDEETVAALAKAVRLAVADTPQAAELVVTDYMGQVVARASPQQLVAMLADVITLRADGTDPKLGPTLGSEEDGDRPIVEVFFGTDRKRTKGPVFFSSARARLSYGRAAVSIPHVHSMGCVERPSLWKFQRREDGAKHIVITECDVIAPENFREELVRRSDRNHALLFIHGYNVAFPAAVRRTAQLKWDLQFPGPALLYSWPSKASLPLYSHDASVVERAVPHFTRFLGTVQRAGVTTLHVVAHSMGNRLLLTTLQTDAARHLVPLLGEMVFAAPDVDQDVFRTAITFLRKYVPTMTMYSSSYDRALQASHVFNGAPRAGDSGKKLLVVRGVDTVDASTAATVIGLNHAAFGDSKPVLADIYEMIDGRKRPPRLFIEERNAGPRRHWAVKR